MRERTAAAQIGYTTGRLTWLCSACSQEDHQGIPFRRRGVGRKKVKRPSPILGLRRRQRGGTSRWSRTNHLSIARRRTGVDYVDHVDRAWPARSVIRSKFARPKFHQPEHRPRLGAQGSDLCDFGGPDPIRLVASGPPQSAPRAKSALHFAAGETSGRQWTIPRIDSP